MQRLLGILTGIQHRMVHRPGPCRDASNSTLKWLLFKTAIFLMGAYINSRRGGGGPCPDGLNQAISIYVLC